MGIQIEEDLDSTIDKEDKVMHNLIQALDAVLSSDQLDQKSDLTPNNIIGMIRALNYAVELKELYKVDIQRTVLNLIAEKLSKMVSLDRKGRNEIIEIVRAIRAELQTEGLGEMGQRFIYGPK